MKKGFKKWMKVVSNQSMLRVGLQMGLGEDQVNKIKKMRQQESECWKNKEMAKDYWWKPLAVNPMLPEDEDIKSTSGDGGVKKFEGGRRLWIMSRKIIFGMLYFCTVFQVQLVLEKFQHW